MRAWVMSDLHVDSTMFLLPPTPPDIDAIIIAGDVADGHDGSTAWLSEHAVPRGLPVLYIAGNHDVFGHDRLGGFETLYEAAGVTLLHPGRPTTIIAGCRLVGTTLWTDYHITGDAQSARAWARRSMPDMVSIDVGMRRVTTRDLLEEHARQRALLEEELSYPYDGSTVVITHHAPHPGSLRSPEKRDPSDGSFASDLSDLMDAFQPAAWVHGHTHISRDYYHNATRVVCNPRGPVLTTKAGIRIENPEFGEELVIEI